MEKKLNPANAFQTFVVIWLALLFSQVLFLALTYFTVEEVFPIDFSQPILGVGDQAWILYFVAFLSVDALIFSFYYRARLRKQSVEEQKLEIVQQALITSIALSETVTIWGLFLAFAIHYQYFFVWMIIGFSATLLHFPSRKDIANATFKGQSGSD